MPLLERAGELDRAAALIQATREGRGAVLAIAGPAGIGKTALLEAALGQAETAGLTLLQARAGQLERDLSWNVVRQLFAPVITAAAGERRRMLSGAAGLAAPALGLSQGADTGALHGLYWLTNELARDTAAVLALDDAHWGDETSLRYLAYVAERVQDLPVLVLLGVRTGEAMSEPLAVLMSRAETMVLRELSRNATTELARRELGAQADARFCVACHSATGGNAFLLRELLSALRRDQVTPDAAHAEEVATITPATVTRSVLLRLSRLPEAARQLADAVAVLGDPPLQAAAKLAGMTADQARSSADTLAAAAILRPGAPLQFAHPLVREVIYGELPPLQRSRLHAQAARVLASTDVGERVAAQLLQTEPEGDDWVVEQLCAAAATSMQAGAPEATMEYLRRALREPPSADRRASLLMALARAEGAAGDGEAAERMATALTFTSEPRERAEMLLERGRLLYNAGQLEDSAGAFQGGLNELAADDHVADPELHALLQAGWLTAARLVIPLRARAEEITYAVARNPPPGASYGERALLSLVAGQLTFDAAPHQQAIELALRALGEGELIRQETSDGLAWISAMGALGWGDELDAYDSLQAEAVADARRRGSVIGYANAMYGYSFSHYYRGMLADAVADAEQAIAAAAAGWRHFLIAARAQLAWALIDRGELEAAAGHLERVRPEDAAAATSGHALVPEARARIELLRAQPKRSLASALQAGEILTEARIPNPSVLPWRSRAALAAGALGDRDRAEALLEEELTLTRRFGAPRPIAVALTAAGAVRGAGGIEALEEAEALLAASPFRLEYARTLVLLGAALRRAGRRSAAQDRLGAGLALAGSLGATVLEERAGHELTVAGVRPQRRMQSGTAALTPAELRVAEAAAAGLSNREIAQALFVSLRTVETHLTHCYQKLGIAARAQLAHELSGSR